jgi:putative ABC transport system permease protein
VRAAIQQLDRDLPIIRLGTMEERLTNSIGQRRFSTLLLGFFAAIAMVLACIGIYGVMSYSVTQRQQELGVRMALGAARGSVLGLVMRQGMVLALLGIVIGLAGAFGLTRLMTSQLYDVKATDPATFVGVALLLATVALVAILLPALRATRVDPVVALRNE